jgi:SAM-dependent methyltransferase
MNCPLCADPSKPLFEKDGYAVNECTACGHQFAAIETSANHAAAIYTDTYFFGGGAGYDDYLSEDDLLIEHGSRYGKMLHRYLSNGTVLDVGSAAGFIVKGLGQQGWDVKGIEPNATMAAHAREKLQVDVRVGTFEAYDCSEQVDVITMIQVIAHFYDVRRAIEVAAQCLHSGGLLLVETWDRASLPARLLKQNWHEYSPPSVVHWFSQDGLRDFVTPFGFEEIARGRPSKWIKSGHAKSLVKYKLESMRGGSILAQPLKLLPDSLKLPYPSFDLFWSLYKRL